MLYLELYCTDGTGWRIAIPREDVKIAGGKAEITGIPTVTADHPCELMSEFALVTDEAPQGGIKPASGYVRLLTGRLNFPCRQVSSGEQIVLHPIEVSVG